MLHLQKRILAVLAACVTSASMLTPAVQAAITPSPASARDVSAVLTAKKGTVFKREFRDWNREEWGEPAPAEVSDQLREGMQIGTGNESWAEVQWPNVKTRAWANTVFAVAPNKRLVYLTGGEMLFRLDKHRKDKDDYYIWTKVLQARIRGTTVLVQAKGQITRFTVMEGTVELTNRLDKSRVMLQPGAVWEIKGYGQPTSTNKTDKTEQYKPAPLAVPKKLDSSITEVTYDATNYLPVFQDKYAASNVYASNREALLNHPLLTVGEPIDSLPLIQDAQKDLPGFNKMLPIKLADQPRLTKVISSAVNLIAVPSKANYFVGQSIGHDIKLPAMVGDLQPDGLVMNPATLNSQRTASPTAALPPRTALPPVLLAPVYEAPNGSEDGTKGKDSATVFDEEPQPLPSVPLGAVIKDPNGNTTVPSLVPNTCLTPSGLNPTVTSTSAFQPLPGAVANPMPTINGVISPAMSGVTGATTGAGAMINNVTTTSGAALGGTLNTVAAPVNTLLPNATQTLQNTLNGVGGITNGLFGR